MHLLRMICILFLLGSVFSCKSQGPLTPEEAYNDLKKACEKTRAGDIETLLSERSKKKIMSVIHIISSMDDTQLKALSDKFLTDADGLRSLSVKEYLNIQLSVRKPDDVFSEIANNNITGVDVDGDKALVRVENGMEFVFVMEGPYWRFDMEELSARD